jgi:tetratricopeptide (TPR) repeat protein
MLDRKRFKRSPNRAKLLSFVVECDLRSIELTENIIGRAIFPGYEDDLFDDVRITARNLRLSLKEYYAKEGAGDLVKIWLARGARYKPTITYNHSSLAVREYSQGVGMLSQLRLAVAEEKFINAINAAPKYAQPYLGMARVCLLFRICGGVNRFSHDRVQEVEPENWLRMAKGLISMALRINRNSSEGLVLCGVVHAFQCKWKKAQNAFERALKNYPDETRNDPWYAAYLVTIGKFDEGVAILEARVNDDLNDPIRITQYGLVKYVMRDFVEAGKSFETACKIDARYWPAYVGLALAAMEMNKEVESTDWMLGLNEHIKKAFPMYFPGILALWMGRAGKVQEAYRRANVWLANMDALQMALTYIGIQDTEGAVWKLEEAFVEDHHPLLLWVHLWPALDPLRCNKAFQSLIQRLKPPEA